MKRVVYLLIVCLFPLLASAQWKTIEKSSKKRPAWVGGAERNYLIVSTEAATIEEAKEKYWSVSNNRSSVRLPPKSNRQQR